MNLKKVFALFIFYLGSLLTSFSQNLVPNLSFEEIDSIPCKWTTVEEFNVLFKDWFQPTRGTTDIFTTYVDSSCYSSCYSTHEWSRGMQKPRSGNVMGSVLTLSNACGTYYDYREYLSIKLTEPLDSGKTYYAEMFVSRGDFVNIVTNNLGMYFTSDSIAKYTHFDCGYLNLIPQINEDKLIFEENEWVKISGYFTASENARFLIIGNLYSTYSTTFQQASIIRGGSQAWIGFYFVDDVLVRPCLSVTPDTLICRGDSVTLRAWGSQVYGWADETEPEVILSTDSVFSVSPDITTTYFAYSICDTLSVTVSVPEQLKDTTICPGDSVYIPLKYTDTQNYNTGDSSVWLWETGYYALSRAFPYCIQTDTFTLSHKSPPILDLGSDTLICKIDTVILDVTEDRTSFKWEDGSEDPIRIVTQPGYYTVQGWLDGCYSENSIDIKPDLCKTELLMPNVISPNRDSKNEVFVPIAAEGLISVNLNIYNRYGVKLFSADSFDRPWDGTFKNEPVPTGAYYFMLSYRDKNDIYSTVKGSITVIR